jgi:hypothetical protein
MVKTIKIDILSDSHAKSCIHLTLALWNPAQLGFPNARRRWALDILLLNLLRIKHDSLNKLLDECCSKWFTFRE